MRVRAALLSSYTSREHIRAISVSLADRTPAPAASGHASQDGLFNEACEKFRDVPQNLSGL
jgi:hypothetical protein